MFNPTQAPWFTNGGSGNAEGVLVEDTSDGVHSFNQPIQYLVDRQSMGRSAILKARVKPLGRKQCWLGCREDSNDDTAWFDLAGDGEVLKTGARVSKASITAVPEEDAFDVMIAFNGSLPQSILTFSIGATVNNGIQKYIGGDNEAIQVMRAQLIKGVTNYAYESTRDRGSIAGIATAPSLNASGPRVTLPEDVNEWPLISNPEYIRGGPKPLTITEITYDRSAFTVCALVAFGGTVEMPDVIAQHYSEQGRAWKMELKGDGKFTVTLSGNGTDDEKVYEAQRTTRVDDPILITFSWNGARLRMYYNEVELKGVELDVQRDEPMKGPVGEAVSPIELLEASTSKVYDFRIFSGVATQEDIEAVAREFDVSGLPRKQVSPSPVQPTLTGGDLPRTLDEMRAYLREKHQVTAFFYVDNKKGNNSNAGSEGAPWKTIQQAADRLQPGQAVIISGHGGRFYEQITPRHSGQEGKRIWFVGNPEAPCIVDASESFDVTWTSMGSNRWRANYGRHRHSHFEDHYRNYCSDGYPKCKDSIYHASHQLIHNDHQMFVRHTGSIGHGEPGALGEGECYFENGSGSKERPQFVWCRLPGDIDPNTQMMRVASGKRYLFDWSPHTWVAGFPGGAREKKADGRDHIGLLNMHFKFGATIIKLGPVNVRGNGWWLEWCSFCDAKHNGLGISGGGHTVKNCKFERNGQGPIRPDFLQKLRKNDGHTLFEDCHMKENNFQKCPDQWEAGTKFTECMDFGLVEFRRCWFYREKGPGVWWDIFNGTGNSGTSCLITHSIFEECAGHTLFLEHNTEHVVIEHSGVWHTRETEEKHVSLATGIRCQGTGSNTIRNCAIVFNEGKGLYFKNHDDRGRVNRDVIENNVVINNAHNPRIDIQRCQHMGGDGYSSGGCQPYGDRKWSTSKINGNVYFGDGHDAYFVRDRNCNDFQHSNSVSDYESWHGGSGNVIANSAGDVVEDYKHRKKFWVTNHAGGRFPDKGPQGLVHPEDIEATQWEIPG